MRMEALDHKMVFLQTPEDAKEDKKKTTTEYTEE